MSYKQLDIRNYKEVMDKYHVGSLLAKVVSSTTDDIDSFFVYPNEFKLDDKHYQKAVDLLEEIKANNEKVFIFGDYDCDGFCSTTIMMMLLDKLGISHGHYIPNRITEGYGLNLERLKQAYQKGYKVLVTVDNGVSCKEQLAWAKENGMKVIVTDHHVISKDVNCDVLLHPSLYEKDYQYLCGSAVVYLLAEYLHLADDKMRILAMIATISDVMELKGINLKIVKDGLKLLNEHKYPNIEALGGFTYPINETDISFRVAPSINAIGRLPDLVNPEKVIKYLLANDISIINQYATLVNSTNNTRKQMSKDAYNNLSSQINEDAVCNILYDENVHEGLVGLIASRIASETGKVTFIFTESEGIIKGSGRSIESVNLMDLLEGFRENTIALGGHSQACGISITKDKMENFKEYLESCLSNIDTEVVTEVLSVDLNDLSINNIKEVFEHRPYGNGRDIPLLMVKVTNFDRYQMMRNDHQLKWNKNGIDFVSFNNFGYGYYQNRDELTFIGRLSENVFRGKVSYQIMVEDIVL